MKKIRVLVVDDSVLFRNLLVQSLSEDPYLEVVAQAGDAYAARDAILEYRPDVMTLDVEMPKMDGIQFLRKLMPQYPLPVVVISALDARVFDAMEAGAVDFVCKPSTVERSKVSDFIRKELGTKIKIASTVRVGNLKRVESNPVRGVSAVNKDMVIAIGASTGGTEAIFEVVKQFRTDIPGVVIVQHMPPGFTEMYANRLNNQCQVAVKEAVTGDKVLPGRVLIAPGDKHMRLVKVNGVYQVECKAGEKVSGHCPSVDVLFSSVAKTAGRDALGVILTGMGGDGANGLLEMRKAGAKTIGQNEATCVVYGMPKVAYDIGAVQYQMELSSITNKIYGLLKTN
ncbi:MAG: chemotaxis response regulator protein-glutamate methylesterase [Lachnospiraceae bacterium]|jgi:Chemotaxis response regulator containing a CheY-like receiver domain and a methylesterase domain|nr:chemotaxis response regulator protein-glutamate methylesterase [Lachnospiraceae bacterium]